MMTRTKTFSTMFNGRRFQSPRTEISVRLDKPDRGQIGYCLWAPDCDETPLAENEYLPWVDSKGVCSVISIFSNISRSLTID